LQLNDLVGLEAEGQGFAAFVSEVDGFGVWLAIAGRVGERLLIVPWHFVRAIEVEPERGDLSEVRRTIGFQR